MKMKKQKKEKEPEEKKTELSEMEAKLPKEAQEKIKAIKSKLEKFKSRVIEKFDKYITGIALLPPSKQEAEKEKTPEQINVLVLVDDSDSQKMSKEELKSKLSTIIEGVSKEVDESLKP